jgi:ribosomal protein S18 acetylase RimI-like enzyme
MWLRPIPLQRIEGVALFALAIALFAWSDRSWWWFGLLLLAPDLFMIGYARGPALGAAVYNVGHALVWPAGLLAVGIPAGRPMVAAIGAVWLAHIGMDRALGYGLKLEDGFTHTHLGLIGRRA